MKKYFLLLFFFALSSCSSDDSKPFDKTTVISMKVNGEKKVYTFGGYSVGLRNGGKYQLDLFAYGSEPMVPNFMLTIFLNEKGKDKIDYFSHGANPNGSDANVVDGVFASNVTVNNRKRFDATFSGTMQKGQQTVVITEGVFHIEYDEPLLEE